MWNYFYTKLYITTVQCDKHLQDRNCISMKISPLAHYNNRNTTYSLNLPTLLASSIVTLWTVRYESTLFRNRPCVPSTDIWPAGAKRTVKLLGTNNTIQRWLVFIALIHHGFNSLLANLSRCFQVIWFFPGRCFCICVVVVSPSIGRFVFRPRWALSQNASRNKVTTHIADEWLKRVHCIRSSCIMPTDA